MNRAHTHATLFNSHSSHNARQYPGRNRRSDPQSIDQKYQVRDGCLGNLILGIEEDAIIEAFITR